MTYITENRIWQRPLPLEVGPKSSLIVVPQIFLSPPSLTMTYSHCLVLCHLSWPASALLVLSCQPFSTPSVLTGTLATAFYLMTIDQTSTGGVTSSHSTMAYLTSRCHLGWTIPGSSPWMLATVALVAISTGNSSTLHSRDPSFTVLVTTLTSSGSCLSWKHINSGACPVWQTFRPPLWHK